MRKTLIALLMIALVISCGIVFAADWSQYESGRNNIRLDGYDDQPGYIAFTDGSGNTTGYLWYDENDDVLRYCSNDAIDLTTTKLSDAVGIVVGTGY